MPVVDLEINTDDFYSQFDVTGDQVEQILDNIVKGIASSFASEWEEEARRTLNSTRERYIANLSVIDEGRLKGVVVLDYTKDPLVRMIEEGASAFDQKEGFAKSDKRIAKDDGGWYLTVPMRQGTPNNTGSASMSNTMPEEIYEAAKNLPAGKGLKLSTSIPEQYKIPQTRAAFSSIPTSKAFDEYQHKASKYKGIVKIKDVITGQNTYTSFRRVSDKSDPNSWAHPGIEAKNLADKAYNTLNQNLEVRLTQAVDNALQSLGII